VEKDFSKKFNDYANKDILESAREWFEKYKNKLDEIFNNSTLSNFIFEPFISLFNLKQNILPKDIYKTITLVAITNAVLAGLPGKMGIGVMVSIGLEIWMALKIAQHLKLTFIKTAGDILKLFVVLASASFTAIYVFKQLLSFAFSIFSSIPMINPLIFAEFFVTNFIGIAFYIGFRNLKRIEDFQTNYSESAKVTQELFGHQWGMMKEIFNLENIKLVGNRFWNYLNGNVPVDHKYLNGEVFSTMAMGYLLSNQYEKLEGPLGEKFLQAIRLRWSAQFNEETSIDEIANRFSEYEPEQIQGAINTIKGKMFELMVEDIEQNDGDEWMAKLHSDESFPGSDIVLTNDSTGEVMEISLKAASTDSREIIEKALVKYPNTPIMTTDEVAAMYSNNPKVFGSGVSHKDLENITQENFNKLLDKVEPINEHQVVIGGVTFGTLAVLYPFVISYIKRKITEEQLKMILVKVLGDSGVKLASRLTYATVFGPIFAWWLLARGVAGIVNIASSDPIKRISFISKRSQNTSA
tara:strand:+ start:206 stop:1777 length:1572 start_codon:yes stop_codon:yes gene_type:complete